MPETRERWRYRLPHWEVAGRPHFVTIRCAGSLPAEALARVKEIHAALAVVSSASPQFAVLQRQYFLTCEKYLDRGIGFTPFLNAAAAAGMLEDLAQLESRAGWTVPHVVVMPNHLHFSSRPGAIYRCHCASRCEN